MRSKTKIRHDYDRKGLKAFFNKSRSPSVGARTKDIKLRNIDVVITERLGVSLTHASVIIFHQRCICANRSVPNRFFGLYSCLIVCVMIFIEKTNSF